MTYHAHIHAELYITTFIIKSNHALIQSLAQNIIIPQQGHRFENLKY